MPVRAESDMPVKCKVDVPVNDDVDVRVMPEGDVPVNGNVHPDGPRQPPQAKIPCPRQGCSNSYTTRKILKRHINEVHEKKKITCTICGKPETSGNISRHKRTHNGNAKVRFSNIL